MKLEPSFVLTSPPNPPLHEVEDEVAIERCLDDARHHRHPVDMNAGESSVHPAKEVEEPVASKREYILSSDILNVFLMEEHGKLRENGEGFEPQSEAVGHTPH